MSGFESAGQLAAWIGVAYIVVGIVCFAIYEYVDVPMDEEVDAIREKWDKSGLNACHILRDKAREAREQGGEGR